MLSGSDAAERPTAKGAEAEQVTLTPEPKVELPCGGRRIIPRPTGSSAFYGAPQDRQLGALGIGSPAQAARSLERQAKAYARKSRPVLPAMELIAVVAAPTRARTTATEPAAVRRGDPALPGPSAPRKAKALLILDIQPAARRLLHPTTSGSRSACASPMSDSRSTPSGGWGRGRDPRSRRSGRVGAREVNAYDRLAGPARRPRRPAAEAAADPPVHRRHDPRGRAEGAQARLALSSTSTASARRR